MKKMYFEEGMLTAANNLCIYIPQLIMKHFLCRINEVYLECELEAHILYAYPTEQS